MYKIVFRLLLAFYFCGITPSATVGRTGDIGFKDVSAGDKSVISRSVTKPEIKPTQATAQAASSSETPERRFNIAYNDGKFKVILVGKTEPVGWPQDEYFEDIIHAGTLQDLKTFIDLANANKVKLNFVDLDQGLPQHLVRDDVSAIFKAIKSRYNPVEKVNYLWKFYSPKDLEAISKHGRFGDTLQNFLIELTKNPNEEIAEHLIELIKLTNRSMTDIDSTRGNGSFYNLDERKILRQIAEFAKQDTPLSQKVIQAIIEKEPKIIERLRAIYPELKLPTQAPAKAASNSDVTSTEKLYDAIRKNDLKGVIDAIADGANLLNTDPRTKRSALAVAAEDIVHSGGNGFLSKQGPPSLGIFKELLKYATPEILNHKYEDKIVMMSLLYTKGDAFIGNEKKLAQIFTAFLERYKELGILPDIDIDAFKKSWQYQYLKDIDVNYDGKIIKFEGLVNQLKEKLDTAQAASSSHDRASTTSEDEKWSRAQREVDDNIHFDKLKHSKWYEQGKRAKLRNKIRATAVDKNYAEKYIKQYSNILDRFYDFAK